MYPPAVPDESPWLRDELLAKVDYLKLTPKDQKSISPKSAMSHEQLGKRSNNTLQEDLRGQVPTQFAKEWALDGDGLKGKLLDAGWNVAAASHLQRKLNVSSAWRTVPR